MYSISSAFGYSVPLGIMSNLLEILDSATETGTKILAPGSMTSLCLICTSGDDKKEQKKWIITPRKLSTHFNKIKYEKVKGKLKFWSFRPLNVHIYKDKHVNRSLSIATFLIDFCISSVAGDTNDSRHSICTWKETRKTKEWILDKFQKNK